MRASAYGRALVRPGIEILCRELDRGLCFSKRCGLMATKVPQASTTAWRRAAARARTEAGGLWPTPPDPSISS